MADRSTVKWQKVTAVVVTHNRPEDLKRCVSALLHQTYPLCNIIVFDNAGAQPVRDVLPADPKLHVERSEANRGGAGGFAAGLELALKQDVDWVFLLDDDAVAQPDALEQLLLAEPDCQDCGVLLCGVNEFSEIAVRHRRRFDRLSGFEWSISRSSYWRKVIQVDTGSFVGFLVRAKIARNIPLPNADYFLAFDDTEYSLSIRQTGASLWLVPGSRIDHLRSSDSRLRQGPFGWKHFLNVRNHMVVKMRYAKIKPFALTLSIVYGLAVWLRSGGLQRPSSLKLLFRALGDGLACRLGPPRW